MSDPLEAQERARPAVVYGAMATVAPLVATVATAVQWLRVAPSAGTSEPGGMLWALLTATFAAASALVFVVVTVAVALTRWFDARTFD